MLLFIVKKRSTWKFSELKKKICRVEEVKHPELYMYSQMCGVGLIVLQKMLSYVVFHMSKPWNTLKIKKKPKHW